MRYLLFLILMLLISCQNCDDTARDFRKIIEEDFNYCTIDEDCKVAIGVCPLGCFFLVHQENIVEIERKKKALSEMDCCRCVYTCLPSPKKLACVKNTCYPDISDRYFAGLFRGDCKGLIELYGIGLLVNR